MMLAYTDWKFLTNEQEKLADNLGVDKFIDH